MTRLRLDQVHFSTFHEAPKNYETINSSIAISGTIASGATSIFSASLPYTRSGTRADVFLDGNNKRVSASSGPRAAGAAYSYKSSETFSVEISYSPTTIDITLSIFNGTGGSITLTSQTITVVAVLIDAPIGAL